MAKNSFLSSKTLHHCIFSLLIVDAFKHWNLLIIFYTCAFKIFCQNWHYFHFSSSIYSPDPRWSREAAVQLPSRRPLQGGRPADHPVRGHGRWESQSPEKCDCTSRYPSYRRAAPECSLVQRQHHHWQNLHCQWEGRGAEHSDDPEAGQGRHGPEVQMRGLQHQHEPGPGDLDHPGHHVWVVTEPHLIPPRPGLSPEGVMRWDAEKFSMLPPSPWPRSHDKCIFSSPAGSQDRYRGPAHGVRQRIQPQVCVLGLPPSRRDILVPETVLRSQGEMIQKIQGEMIVRFIITRYQERERSFYLLWYQWSGLEIIILSINGLGSNRPSLATFRFYSR